jgi:hypothetical protein
MKKLQKMGGISALYAGAAYIVAMVVFLVIVDVSSVVDPVEKVALMADNQAVLSIMHLITYVVWGVFLVVLTLALYERLKAGSPALMQIVTAIGVIWACMVIAAGMVHNVGMENVVDLYDTDPAQAGTVWLAIESVFGGIGGENEILGGIWVLLISWAALRAGGLPRALNYLGLVIAAAGILSAFPGLRDVGMVFGVVQIVWFIWLGIVLLRGSASEAA